LDLALVQGSHAWELRTAIELATLTADTERRDSTRELLASVYLAFAKGDKTADLAKASALLSMLSATAH